MPKKIKLEFDHWINDLVYHKGDDSDVKPAIITQIVISEKEVMYQVARGLDEKLCYAGELVPASEFNTE